MFDKENDPWKDDPETDDAHLSIEPMIIDVNENPALGVMEIFRQNVVAAAMTIVTTAKGGIHIIEELPNGQKKDYIRVPSRLEYDAARYVVEFVCGKPIGMLDTSGDDKDPQTMWDKMRAEILGSNSDEA